MMNSIVSIEKRPNPPPPPPAKRIKIEEDRQPEPSPLEASSVCQTILAARQNLNKKCLLLKRVYELIKRKTPIRVTEICPSLKAIVPEPSDQLMHLALKLKSLEFVRLVVNLPHPPAEFPELVIKEMQVRPPKDADGWICMAELLPHERMKSFLTTSHFRKIIFDNLSNNKLSKVLQKLKEKGLFLNFMQIALENNDDMYKAILYQEGIEIHGLFPGGKTALHLACEQNNKTMISMLLAHGSNPFQCDDEGFTPFCAYNPELHQGIEDTLLQIVSETQWTLPAHLFREVDRSNINRFIRDVLMGKSHPAELFKAEERGYLSLLAAVLLQVAPGARRVDLLDQLYVLKPLIHDELPHYARIAKDILSALHKKRAAQEGFHTLDASCVIQKIYEDTFQFAHLLPKSEASQELIRWFCTDIGKPLKHEGSLKSYVYSLLNPDGSWKRQAAIDLLLQMGIISHINEKYHWRLGKQPL